MRTPFLLILVLALIFILIGLVLNFKNQPKEKKPEVSNLNSSVLASPTVFPDQREKAKVLRVIDGDTIEVEFIVGGKAKVRYIGIDTPEFVDSRTSVECFGKEASSKNKELVEDKEVELEKDVSETDKFGRLLRYVYTSDGLFVNEFMVKEGYAHAATFPPDVKYQEVLRWAQDEAQGQNRGLWAVCPVEGSSSVLPTLASQGETLRGLVRRVC